MSSTSHLLRLGELQVTDPVYRELLQRVNVVIHPVTSERQYARYARYGRQDVDGFREHFHEGILVYLSLTGAA